eukprot:TRINITY_DN1161_c0_g1_i13.p2 TRINITY_DN1161_c0_g1~~TRINITY_DN1161_c0_g1_i13.p2  ORF type:complete len:106 (+),score=23.89 TRINITY_DN1161_c0_g1_i13:269-586(+)
MLFIGPAATTSDPPLAVTYNSGNSSSGGFGPGWFGYFERRVTVGGSVSDVSVLGDNGDLTAYQKVGTAPGDRKSGSAGMPRPISYAVFCLKKKRSILTVCCPAAS